MPTHTTNSTAATASTNPLRTQRKRKTRSNSTPVGSSPSRSPKKPRKDEDEVMDLHDSGDDVPAPAKRGTDMCLADAIDVDQDEEVIDVDAEGDTHEDDGTWNPEQATFNLLLDEEEKPKPALQLRYKGFGIHGQCLCIVVEPWPTIRSTTRASQALGGITSQKSDKMQAIRSSVSTITARAKTPLFLADDNATNEDDAENQRLNSLTNPWDDLETMDDSDDGSEMGGMMAFSQALTLADGSRPGAVEDDDEMEGAALFGDADEARHL